MKEKKAKEEEAENKAVKEAFDKLDVVKIPKVKELNQQISEGYDKKRNAVEEYYQLKEKMREMMIVRGNIKIILENGDGTNKSIKEKKEEILLM